MGEIVGFAFFSYYRITGVAYWRNLFVLPIWRQHGVASQLLKSALSLLHTRGCSSVVAFMSDNEEDINTMAAFGFKQRDRFIWFERET